MEFHKELFPRERVESKCVNAKALHHPVGPRDRSVRHNPHAHVSSWLRGRVNKCDNSKTGRSVTFRLQASKIPKIIVCRLSLRHLIMGFRFNSMNEIGELDRFLYEENRNIIPDQIPISFGRVKLGGKAANVSDGILRQETSRVSMERVVHTIRNVQHYHASLGLC